MRTEDLSLVVIDKFIQATRDSGYKGTPSAVAEVLDNSLQAGAQRVEVCFFKRAERADPLDVYVLDDGEGMSPAQLQQALRFGGSARFNDRGGMGRFGMGLPNSSLSQARRVEVYTWQRGCAPQFTYIDVDEIISGAQRAVPAPEEAPLPADVPWEALPESGTLVCWLRCDRLDNKRAATNARKLKPFLGRVFRHFIWAGVELLVDGEAVAAVDPLMLTAAPALGGIEALSPPQREARAAVFGEPLIYEVQAPSTSPDPGLTGLVTVTFTELPVHAWHDLKNEDKRALGISKGAGVSVVRGDREVELGWHFLSGKRRENYDDWWRCEVRFDPVLDEAFGITHTKQQIRPMEYLSTILKPDMEEVARALNARVRQAHANIKLRSRFSEVERLASAKDALLPPLAPPAEAPGEALVALRQRHPSLQRSEHRYKIVEDTLAAPDAPSFFDYARAEGQFVLTINPQHPFYKRVYKPLLDEGAASATRGQLELLLLAAARACEAAEDDGERAALARWRERWGQTVATFLNT